MSANERVEYQLPEIPFEQLAPSKSAQTEFVPGKATSQPLDANWPTDFKIPVGIQAHELNGPVGLQSVRVIKLDRNTVSDQVISAPEVLGTTVTTIVDEAFGIQGTSTLTETATQDNDGDLERTAGYNWPADL